MTHAEIMALEGRELDVSVSERVFGQKIVCWEPGFAPEGPPWTILPGDESAEKQPWIAPDCRCGGRPRKKHYFNERERLLVGAIRHDLRCLDVVPFYSSTWEGMGLLVDAMGAKGFVLKLVVFPGGRADARFHRHDWNPMVGRSSEWVEYLPSPLAVARAALLAIQ